jgi:hypothetical protein
VRLVAPTVIDVLPTRLLAALAVVGATSALGCSWVPVVRGEDINRIVRMTDM